MHAEQVDRTKRIHGTGGGLDELETTYHDVLLHNQTLFEEDINGVGAWDRRWCFLNNQCISFWKYPEDEFKQSPLGTINLVMCVNASPLGVLPRDLCARKHTIELLICQTITATAAKPDLSDCKR